MEFVRTTFTELLPDTRGTHAHFEIARLLVRLDHVSRIIVNIRLWAAATIGVTATKATQNERKRRSERQHQTTIRLV